MGPLGDQQGVVGTLGMFEGKAQRPHLRRRLEVIVVGVELEAVGLADERVGLDAQEHVVRFCVGPACVVRVVGEEERCTGLLGEGEELWRDLLLLGDPVLHHLDEEVVGPEHVAVAPGRLVRRLLLVGQQQLRDQAAEASRCGDEAFRVVGQQLVVDARLVVEALEEGAARELHEVAVPLVVLGQERHVHALLVGPAGAVETGAGRVVALHAQHRVDALRLALAVELDQAVQHPVVGDGEGRLPEGGGLLDDLFDAGGAVEHGVLAVDMEVGEAGGGRPVVHPFPPFSTVLHSPVVENYIGVIRH